ncbi:MAG TPA: hypothetical protein VG164_09570 [Trebonia sp.]|nr:hypothetical protein [Trebonia sp.]
MTGGSYSKLTGLAAEILHDAIGVYGRRVARDARKAAAAARRAREAIAR